MQSRTITAAGTATKTSFARLDEDNQRLWARWRYRLVCVSSPTTTTAVRRSDSTKRSLSDQKSEPTALAPLNDDRPMCPGNVSSQVWSRLPMIPRLLPDDDFTGETCRTDPNDNRWGRCIGWDRDNRPARKEKTKKTKKTITLNAFGYGAVEYYNDNLCVSCGARAVVGLLLLSCRGSCVPRPANRSCCTWAAPVINNEPPGDTALQQLSDCLFGLRAADRPIGPLPHRHRHSWGRGTLSSSIVMTSLTSVQHDLCNDDDDYIL